MPFQCQHSTLMLREINEVLAHVQWYSPTFSGTRPRSVGLPHVQWCSPTFNGTRPHSVVTPTFSGTPHVQWCSPAFNGTRPRSVVTPTFSGARPRSVVLPHVQCYSPTFSCAYVALSKWRYEGALCVLYVFVCLYLDGWFERFLQTYVLSVICELPVSATHHIVYHPSLINAEIPFSFGLCYVFLIIIN